MNALADINQIHTNLGVFVPVTGPLPAVLFPAGHVYSAEFPVGRIWFQEYRSATGTVYLWARARSAQRWYVPCPPPTTE